MNLNLNNYNTNDLLNKYIERIKSTQDKEEFLLIGDTSYDVVSNENDTQIYFEIFCRWNLDEVDFLFNDVTRTKMMEKSKAEVKYKTLFLAKVAHEFKNPLICISEMVEEINDDNNISNPAVFKDCFSKIKSMSQFLIMLIKDLDFFSQSEMGKKIALEKRETGLSKIIEFCKDIAVSLLKKYHKDQAVSFEVIQSNCTIESIYTDEWRVKQVLVNLISNAIKFTNSGKIELIINIENRMDHKKYLKFTVKDTGTGIKDAQRENMFKPFQKDNSKNNELGTGLGLGIVMDLTAKLGEKLNFYSKYGEGSSFWFSILLEKTEFMSCDIVIYESEAGIISNNNTKLNDNIYQEYEGEKVYLSQEDQEFSQVFQTPNNETLLDSEDNSIDTKLLSCGLAKLPINLRDVSRSKNPSVNSIRNSFKSTPKQTIKKNPSENSNKQYRRKFNVLDFLQPDEESSKILKEKQLSYNIIVVDDEEMTRKANIRIIASLAEDKNIVVNYIEADDGIECLYIVYRAIKLGYKIDLILSDETMNFFCGRRCADLLYEIANEKHYENIPFHLVTSYDLLIKSKAIKSVIVKPINEEQVLTLFE